eukprot:3524828-Amphidinium_carterae.2
MVYHASEAQPIDKPEQWQNGYSLKWAQHMCELGSTQKVQATSESLALIMTYLIALAKRVKNYRQRAI